MTVTSNSCELLTESLSSSLNHSSVPVPSPWQSAETSDKGWVAPLATNIPPGTCLGRYEIKEQLDRGGQAVVFRAWDSRLQREVAVKLGHTPCATDSIELSRIRQEGEILARIDHPGLAKVHDCGSINGAPYLVIEFLRGQNLQQFAERNSLSRRQIIRFLDEISSAVAAAHDAGILHLDLKPENVMVTPTGQYKLIDFGLAWRSGTTSDASPPVIAGTREFLSPEQASGDPQQWTAATDVFGLGGILYQLLTGHPPLPSELLDEEGYREHLSGVGDRLKACDVDPALGELCRTALSPNPLDRYASIGEFRRVLHRRRMLGEKLLASLFILSGLFLLCLGSGLMNHSIPGRDDNNFKDFSRERLAVRASARMSLKIEVQTESPHAPRLMIWSPSLGLREIMGLKRMSVGKYSRWSPRTMNGILNLRSADETVCIMAFDGSSDQGEHGQRDYQNQLRMLLSQIRSEGHASHHTSADFLCPSRACISPANRQHSRLRSNLAQLNQVTEEWGVPFQWTLMTRSVHHQPEWELDLFLDLSDVRSEHCGPDGSSGTN